MTAAEKARLEALKAKAEKTDEEKAELDALLAKEKEGEGGAGDQTYGEAYVKSLRQEAAKYRTKMRELEENLAKFDGIDPEKIQTLLKAQEDAEKRKLEEKGEFTKLREQMLEAHKAELAKKDNEVVTERQRVKELEAELTRTILANEISTAAAVAKAINPKLVEMVALQNTTVETLEDGRRVTRVLDKEGNVKIDMKTGQPLSVAQYIEEMKQIEEFAHLFAGAKVGAGSGTTVSFQGSNVQNPWKAESFNLTLQGKIFKENPELARRLAAEAGKTI